jgi:hypothetical protein
LEFEKRILSVLALQKDAAENLDSEEEVQGPEKRRKKKCSPSPLLFQNIERSTRDVGILYWI